MHILKVIIPVSLSRADQSKRCKLAASCWIQLCHTLTVHNKYKIQIHNSRIQLCHTLEAQVCQCTSISACVSFFYFSICEACILSWIEFRFVGHNIILGCLQCAEPICVLLCILHFDLILAHISLGISTRISRSTSTCKIVPKFYRSQS